MKTNRHKLAKDSLQTEIKVPKHCDREAWKSIAIKAMGKNSELML